MMSYDECDKQVILNGRPLRKEQVPLGKEFVEDGRVYQATVVPSCYSRVPRGARFRLGDKWHYRDATSGNALRVDPNMPFGRPYFVKGTDGFNGHEQVAILEVTERGVAP